MATGIANKCKKRAKREKKNRKFEMEKICFGLPDLTISSAMT